MNAPNKIYLSKLVMAGIESLDKPVSDSDVEYIRKDLLLEWAKEKKAELLDEELTDVAAGINMGMDMLIHKLNSL